MCLHFQLEVNTLRHLSVSTDKRDNVRVTVLRRVREIIVAVENKYPACKAHAPYYAAICGLSGSTTFFCFIS
jgi:hypothetical protein